MVTDQHPATAAALKGKIEMLRAEIAKLEALVASRQTEFRAVVDRDRAEQLMAELLRITADLMSARESATRLEGELTALRALRLSRSWWWRMLEA
jgi:predicted RNase H-like nuclease (RuvC/YqgF family)